MDTLIYNERVTSDQLDALDIMFTKTKPGTGTESTVLQNSDPEKILDKVADKVLNPPEPKQEISEVTVSDRGLSEALDKVVDTTTKVPEQASIEEPAAGRPKTDKDAIVEYLKAKVESKEFGVPEDYDVKVPLDEYLKKLPAKQIYDILDSNWRERESEIRNNAPREFYDALPDPAKDVAIYAQLGGTDWEDFYLRKGAQIQVSKLDPAKEEDQIPIIKAFLTETTQMTSAQINEQVDDWKEMGKLDKKAAEFKAPLNTLYQGRIDAKNQEAQKRREEDSKISEFYVQNLSNTLSSNQLAGVKLDKKFVNELYEGLTGTVAGPFTGRPVNEIGYWLEQKQFIEPDYETIAMVSWLLRDKAGFLNAVGQQSANKAINDQVKLIKLEQGIKGGGSQPAVEEVKPVRRLQNTTNILKRA